MVFGLDYLIRIALARRRVRFVLRHLPDLAILLLPMFRQLRILRLVTVLSVLNRQLRDDARGRVVLYVAGTVTLVGFVAALAVLDAERDAPDASITTFGDALLVDDHDDLHGRLRRTATRRSRRARAGSLGGRRSIGRRARVRCGVVTASIAELVREQDARHGRPSARRRSSTPCSPSCVRCTRDSTCWRRARTVGVPRQDDTRLAGGHSGS